MNPRHIIALVDLLNQERMAEHKANFQLCFTHFIFGNIYEKINEIRKSSNFFVVVNFAENEHSENAYRVLLGHMCYKLYIGKSVLFIPLNVFTL